MSRTQTQVQVTREEMKNILSDVNSPQFISMVTNVPQKMNKWLNYWLVDGNGKKSKNPNPTPNPYMENGILNHSKKYKIITGFDYENSVNSRRKKEGKEENFVSGQGREVWFDVVSKGLVTDKKTGNKFYLRYQYQDDSTIGTPEYLHNGNPIEKQLFQDFLVKRSNSYSNQGLDNTLNFQVCDLNNIISISMNHYKYILTN